MAELRKQWSDGGVLSVTYDGDGDGTAVFASDVNEGVDREMSVTFRAQGVSVDCIVKQEGRRERFGLKDGGVFRIKGGGTFNVLKQNI